MVKCVGERRDNYRSLPPLPLPAVGTHVIEAASHILREYLGTREGPIIFTMYRVPVPRGVAAGAADEMIARRGPPLNPREPVDDSFEGARFLVVCSRGKLAFFVSRKAVVVDPPIYLFSLFPLLNAVDARVDWPLSLLHHIILEAVRSISAINRDAISRPKQAHQSTKPFAALTSTNLPPDAAPLMGRRDKLE